MGLATHQTPKTGMDSTNFEWEWSMETTMDHHHAPGGTAFVSRTSVAIPTVRVHEKSLFISP